MTIVNVDPAPDSFPVIDVDQAPFAHKQISLRVCGIEPFVLVELFKHVRVVGKLENLARDDRPGPAQHRARIFPQVVEPSVYASAANPA